MVLVVSQRTLTLLLSATRIMLDSGKYFHISLKQMFQVKDVIDLLGRDPLMTIQDVCNFTKMSQSTVYEWIAKKGLEVEPSNGVTRIRLSELSRFVGTLDKNTFTQPPSTAVGKCCSKCKGLVCDRCEMCAGACKCGAC